MPDREKIEATGKREREREREREEQSQGSRYLHTRRAAALKGRVKPSARE